MRIAESCQRIIYGKSSAERSRKLPLSLFRIPQLKNYAFPRIAKLSFARIVQLMCSVQPKHNKFSNLKRPTVSSFHILCGPFAKEQASFLQRAAMLALQTLY